jgi:polynucleotide 5'-kinase involved in rRNA processing
MLLSVVERIFRVLKRCYQILQQASTFSFHVQVKLKYAVTALYSLLWKADDEAWSLSLEENAEKREHKWEEIVVVGPENRGISTLWDKIVQKLWDDNSSH